MEDPYPVQDWSVQEYSSEEQSGKLRWTLKKGLEVGKKMLVIGFVISTTPLVLPTLVAISFIGLACSVPSGILLASYACTDKIMSKLLPGCKAPPLPLEYGTMYSNEVVVGDESEGVEILWLKGDNIYMGKEEAEVMDDKWGNVGMRIELVDEEKVLMGDEHEQGGAKKEEQDVLEYVDEDEEGQEAAKEIEVNIASVGEEEAKEPVVEGRSDQVPADELQAVVVNIAGDEMSGKIDKEEVPVFEVSNVVVEVCENKEDEEFMRETRVLLERIREEGMSMTDNRESDKQSLEKLSTWTERREQKFRREVGRLRGSEHEVEENKHYEIPKEIAEKKESGHLEHVDVVKPVESFLGKRNVDNSILERGEVNGTQNVGTTKEEPKVEVERLPELRGRGDVNEEETMSSTNAERGGTGVSSLKDLGMASSKDLYSEKNMWQKINAVRQIVGYKAAKQATCFEELRALYLFTGVEPPASFTSLVEINDKLRFLMSIVGVK